MSAIEASLWSSSELPALIEALARRTGLPGNQAPSISTPGPATDLRVWFENTCGKLGMDVEPVDLWGFRIVSKLRGAAPAAIPVGDRWIALLDRRGDRVDILAPDLTSHRFTLEQLRDTVSNRIEAPHRAEVEMLLDRCGVRNEVRRKRAAAALLQGRTRYEFAGTMFQLRAPAGSSFRQQCRQAGVYRKVAALAGAHLAEFVLWVAAWYILGRDALQGRADPGWLAGWMLILATLVPFRMLTTWTQGTLAIAAGGLLRQRLLAGALKLSPEEMRHEGAGRFLARSIEAELVESLALSGALASALSLIEIAVAMAVLAMGAAGLLQAPLLAAWTGLAVWLAFRYWQARSSWTGTRLDLTHHLVERMTGHRTRIAQEPAEKWHIEEDREADEYTAQSRRMDACAAYLLTIAPSGWLVLGIATLGPAFLSPGAASGPLAVSIGGVLLAMRALRRLVSGAGNLCGAVISWRQVSTLFHAAARPDRTGLVAELPPPGETVLDIRDVSFRQPTGRTVLDRVGLDLRCGDRVLIEGPSGGGKSTLVSLIAGLREPSSGLLLAGGLDRGTLGDTLWHRKIVAAPQYHENHVLTGPFAYNLLMGRNWPAGPEDMREAEAVCVELGLGPLLERMPGGLMQMVGETGWQLSQGERSRMYMARAILQSPEVIVLDESFAALDPENLRQSLECVLRRARTLVVVAHP